MELGFSVYNTVNKAGRKREWAIEEVGEEKAIRPQSAPRHRHASVRVLTWVRRFVAPARPSPRAARAGASHPRPTRGAQAAAGRNSPRTAEAGTPPRRGRRRPPPRERV